MSNKLREIRTLKRISQYMLALQTGIPQSRISIIENALVQPNKEEKRKLAKMLGFKIEEVFSNEEN